MSERGEIINQAYEILKKTYKEIYRLKDDIGDLLAEHDNSIKYFDEYSYSPNNLILKSYHAFFFRQDIDPQLEEGPIRALLMICLFDESRDMNRVNLKGEPELWVGLFEISDELEHCRAPKAYTVLSINKRKYFNKELKIGGDVISYEEKPANGSGEDKMWRGWFVGYPLVEITDREAAKRKILEKLYSHAVP